MQIFFIFRDFTYNLAHEMKQYNWGSNSLEEKNSISFLAR